MLTHYIECKNRIRRHSSTYFRSARTQSYSLWIGLPPLHSMLAILLDEIRAVPAKRHAQQLLVARARWQRQISDEGQRDAEQGLYETLIQEWVACLAAGVCYDPVIPAQIPAPEAAHVP